MLHQPIAGCGWRAVPLHHPGWTLRILGISAVWYNKPFPTFLGVIALARPHLWLTSEGFSRSLVEPDTWKVPAALYHQLIHS